MSKLDGPRQDTVPIGEFANPQLSRLAEPQSLCHNLPECQTGFRRGGVNPFLLGY